MKICIPTESPQGMDSIVFGHFGSAPGFVIVDTQNMQAENIQNGDLHHSHGMCQPLKALGNRTVDAIVVAAIGLGALTKLKEQGIEVYRAVEGTVRLNVDLLQQRKLPRFDPEHTCAGHAGECSHE
jgi:predicted Fe-Mo cluster-binding NifX family protein